VTDDVRAAAERWLSEDPDPDTRAELRRLLDSGPEADAELADRFAGTLEFGTAGLRGAVGAGSNRMNRVVVIRAAAGLAAYLKANGRTDGPVLIGYDARHKSDVFAQDTAAVVRGAGLDAVLLDRPTPTPVIAFGIRHLRAVAGVVVTASHNPPQDNGYKVYLGDGSQIVRPRTWRSQRLSSGRPARGGSSRGRLADHGRRPAGGLPGPDRHIGPG